MSGDEATHPNRDHAMSTIERPIIDEFRGDNELLRENIEALIHLSDSGSLIPHGLPGFGRDYLAACYHRLSDQRADRLADALREAKHFIVYGGSRSKHNGLGILSIIDDALASPSGGEKSGPSVEVPKQPELRQISLGKDNSGQEIIPKSKDQKLSVHTKRHRSTDGWSRGWIEGCTLNICWNNGKPFNEKKAYEVANKWNAAVTSAMEEGGV